MPLTEAGWHPLCIRCASAERAMKQDLIRLNRRIPIVGVIAWAFYGKSGIANAYRPVRSGRPQKTEAGL
jgi:hypothetical protein